MTPTPQPITLSLTAQEASDLISALVMAIDSLYRSPYIFEAKCLDQFHNTLWEAFKDQYIRQEAPDFYAKLLAAESELTDEYQGCKKIKYLGDGRWVRLGDYIKMDIDEVEVRK